MIKTTYVMERDVREALDAAMARTGVGRDELLMPVMKMTLQNHADHVKGDGSIAYQDRSPDSEKSRVHVTLGEMEYEFFNDMRKFFRKSISFMIAISVRQYLEIVVRNILNKKLSVNKNNYPQYKYKIFRKCIENNVFWLIYWGLPPE